MDIVVNGETLTLPKESTVEHFIKLQSLNRDRIIIQLDGNIIKNEHYPTTIITESATIEVMALVGGG